jgi:hypothetical protein
MAGASAIFGRGSSIFIPLSYSGLSYRSATDFMFRKWNAIFRLHMIGQYRIG